MATLYVLGNGFDLSHGLPTRYDPHLKDLAIAGERFVGEWESYSIDGDLWPSVEEQLSHPDIDQILDHLEAFAPDYLSDRESDRDGIIFEAEQLLNFPLEEFAADADEAIDGVTKEEKFAALFRGDDYFLTFNYTHTLEYLHDIAPSRILHVHGEVGRTSLIFGYAPGSLAGVQVLRQFDDEEVYEHYRSRSYGTVRQRLTGFEKPYQLDSLEAFLRGMPQLPNQIVVYGHSLGSVDKPYFERLVQFFDGLPWRICAYDEAALEAACAALDAYDLDVDFQRAVL